MAFTPDGGIYPCERLIGNGSNTHRIGHVESGVKPRLPACLLGRRQSTPNECLGCGVRNYCMNWCGCSNYFSTGEYNRPGAFLCAAERAAIRVAFSAYQELESDLGASFADHLAGAPFLNSVSPA